MKRAKYEDLEIYQLAEKISDRIWEIVIKWNATEKITFGVQVIILLPQIMRGVHSRGKGLIQRHGV